MSFVCEAPSEHGIVWKISVTQRLAGQGSGPLGCESLDAVARTAIGKFMKTLLILMNALAFIVSFGRG